MFKINIFEGLDIQKEASNLRFKELLTMHELGRRINRLINLHPDSKSKISILKKISEETSDTSEDLKMPTLFTTRSTGKVVSLYWMQVLMVFALKDYKTIISIRIIQELLASLPAKYKDSESKNKWINSLFHALSSGTWDEFDSVIAECSQDKINAESKKKLEELTSPDMREKYAPKDIYWMFNERYYESKFLGKFFSYDNPSWKEVKSKREEAGIPDLVGTIPCADNIICTLVNDNIPQDLRRDYDEIGKILELFMTIYYQITLRNKRAEAEPDKYSPSSVDKFVYESMKKAIRDIYRLDLEKSPYFVTTSVEDSKVQNYTELFGELHISTRDALALLTEVLLYNNNASFQSEEYLEVPGAEILKEKSIALIKAKEVALTQKITSAEMEIDGLQASLFDKIASVNTLTEERDFAAKRDGEIFDNIISSIDGIKPIKYADLATVDGRNGQNYYIYFNTEQNLKVNEPDEWARIKTYHKTLLFEYTPDNAAIEKVTTTALTRLNNEEWYHFLMHRVFIEESLKLPVKAFIQLNLSTGEIHRRYDGRASGFNAERIKRDFPNCMPHPHIMDYDCFGTYHDPLIKAARARDYFEEILLGSLSAGGLNYADYSVTSILRQYFTSYWPDHECIFDPKTGEWYSFNSFKAKYIKMLEDAKAERERLKKEAAKAEKAEEAKKAAEAAKTAKIAEAIPAQAHATATPAEAVAEEAAAVPAEEREE